MLGKASVVLLGGIHHAEGRSSYCVGEMFVRVQKVRQGTGCMSTCTSWRATGTKREKSAIVLWQTWGDATS